MTTMKKIFMMALMALPMMFASCDDGEPYWYHYHNYGGNNRQDDKPNDNADSDFWVSMAQTLAGQWRGDLMAYQLDADGTAIDSILYSTDIEFEQYNSKSISGTGTQYDYEVYTDAAGNQYTANDPFTRNFTWYIDPNNGTVYLTYKETYSDGTTGDYVMTIAYDDLNLDDRTFTGYLWAADGGEVDDFWFNRYTEQNSAKRAMLATAGRKAVRLKLVMH